MSSEAGPVTPPQSPVTFTVAIPVPAGPSNAPIVVTAQATDTLGNRSQPVSITLRVRDILPPTAQVDTGGVTQAAPGATLTVTVSGTDDAAVAALGFAAEGALATAATQVVTPAQAATSHFVLVLPVDLLPGAQIALTGIVTDSSGNRTLSAPLVVTIVVDQPPQVQIVAPCRWNGRFFGHARGNSRAGSRRRRRDARPVEHHRRADHLSHPHRDASPAGSSGAVPARDSARSGPRRGSSTSPRWPKTPVAK